METTSSLNYNAVFGVLADLVDIGVLVVSPDGEIDFASPRARTLLGCGSDMLLSTCIEPVRSAVAGMIEAVLRRDAAGEAERELRFRREGKDYYLHVEAHAIEEESCKGFLILLKDVGNMSKMVQDLRLAAQFRNTGRLYRALIHNLRQPVTAILVHVELLKDLIAARSADLTQKEHSLQVIKHEIKDLEHALTLLLEEISPADVEEQGFSLRDVIADIVRLIDPQARQQGVTLEMSLGDHYVMMTGWRQRLKQAILNLAVNALEAMPAGGVLRIEVSVRDGLAQVRLFDTGPGIPLDVLPHIFEMHFTTKATGTGVGLHVAREVVERHHGHIEVQTEEGRGTVFTIVLPHTARQEAELLEAETGG